MAKEWFQHDYGTRNKKKLAVLIHEEGGRGYGLFWIIVEMLYEDRRKKMELDESTYLAIKKESGEDVPWIQEFISKCISRYKVFKKIGKSFFSTDRVLENDKFRKEISKKKSEAGIKSAESRKKMATRVEHTPAPVQEISTNANKGEESTVQEMKGEERIHCEEPEILDPPPIPEIKPAFDLSNSNLARKPHIPTKEKVFECFTRAGGTDEMAESFWNKHEGTGWYLNGSPIVNYSSLVQNYVANWKQNEVRKKEDKTPAHMQSSGGPKLQKL